MRGREAWGKGKVKSCSRSLVIRIGERWLVGEWRVVEYKRVVEDNRVVERR